MSHFTFFHLSIVLYPSLGVSVPFLSCLFLLCHSFPFSVAHFCPSVCLPLLSPSHPNTEDVRGGSGHKVYRPPAVQGPKSSILPSPSGLGIWKPMLLAAWPLCLRHHSWHGMEKTDPSRPFWTNSLPPAVPEPSPLPPSRLRFP
jgi:hypothetical protein